MSDAAERIQDLLEHVADAYQLDASVAVDEQEESIVGTLEGEDLGLVIGRHGQTIDSLQHLAVRIALRDSEERKRIVIDAAGYRERRAEVLRQQADRAASDAVRYGRPVSLDAMGAPERKLVHEYLHERHDVETYSEGEEPRRHLVVAPLLNS